MDQPLAGQAPSAWWSGSLAEFRDEPAASLLGGLARQAVGRFRINEAVQLRAWAEQVRLLHEALAVLPESCAGRLLLEFEIPRLGRRIDAVLLLPGAVLVLEFKIGAVSFAAADRQQAEAYALDLQDFHAGSRRQPIIPILVATDAVPGRQSLPLPWPGAAPEVLEANAGSLPGLIRDLAAGFAAPLHPLALDCWEQAPYRPVPNIIDAARLLFDRHDVAEIASARADSLNLTRTAEAIRRHLHQAHEAAQRIVLFVTGIPGAGKTLCGLNASFGTAAQTGAAFLTGNPTLVHVLREALVRDAIRRGERRGDAEHRMKGLIQALPRFRDDLVGSGHVPAERVIVIDEAQRAWTEAQAVAKTRDRPVRLSQSEPAHLLDVMSRHEGFAAIICLVGNGQEIHDGEGGLAGWGQALRVRPDWRVVAAPHSPLDGEPRNRLGLDGAAMQDAALHLTVPVRSLRSDAAPAWVDAVLRGDAGAARAIVAREGAVPFLLSRSLDALRAALRARCRGLHRCGLIASAGARRLRAEGLGAELAHMDAEAVARWFLDRFPQDVRASDALEQVATQFSVQGLELDHVGLCWDADLVPGPGGWRIRSFRGTDWQVVRQAEKIAYRLNTYRVLLTRARFETIIWVPAGDAADRTRDPAIYDELAGFLASCGVAALQAPQAQTRGLATNGASDLTPAQASGQAPDRETETTPDLLACL